ncbi:hypothetical protein [Rhizobium mayense]|uniref:Uncharacterized protein n=1 Tax=Rhizobium mayense TaxID=1312184 RepID=A0ABT7K4S5_9HYPH|nr:hypothetical protein [Rhizobium mayense]MDL2403621.1 hypothetical protein [Rhizobium mayense]
MLLQLGEGGIHMIPTTLINAVTRGEVVLFFGAGINYDCRHPDGRKMPLGNDLRDLLADHFLGGECKDLNRAGFAGGSNS